MKKKLLLVALFATLLLTSGYLFLTHAKAATVEIDGGTKEVVYKKTPKTPTGSYLSDPRAETTSGNNQVTVSDFGYLPTLVSNMANLLLGTDNIPLFDSETGEPILDQDGAQVQIYSPGAVDGIVSMQSNFYANPPASGLVYAQQQWDQITKGHTAFAADPSPSDSWIYYPGLGYTILKPIQTYWSIARNIAYIAMIIIIVIVAFLVAFRSNFGGQTQVTISNSIPNIILALVMITLSYPLSGFAIDTITIGVNLSQQVLVQNTWSPGYELWTGESTIDTPFTKDIENAKYRLQPNDSEMSVWQIFWTSGIKIDTSEGDLTKLIPTGGIVGDSVKKAVKSIEKNPLGSVILELIFAVAAFMAAFKLFMKILTKYLYLVLYPIISPFIMLTVAIPGQGTKQIMKYFTALFSASLSMIAIYTVFLFMIVLTHDNYFTENINYNPILTGFSEGGIGGIGGYIQNILAFALFMATPAIPDAIDQALGTVPEHFQRTTVRQRFSDTVQGGTGFGAKITQGIGSAGYNRLMNRKPQKKQ